VTCHVCDRIEASAGAEILTDDVWFAGTSGTPGWVMLATRRHGQWLDDLDDSEADRLGPLMARIGGAIRAATGSTHVYFVGLGENTQHFHMVLTPRAQVFADEVHVSMRARIAELTDPDAAAATATALRDHLSSSSSAI
jgi:diadenosine tetraphosphate (Ap4A) HIT family hydrolase